LNKSFQRVFSPFAHTHFSTQPAGDCVRGDQKAHRGRGFHGHVHRDEEPGQRHQGRHGRREPEVRYVLIFLNIISVSEHICVHF